VPRRNDEVVERNAKGTALRLGNTDHTVGDAAHFHVASKRIKRWEQPLRGIDADDHHLLAACELLRCHAASLRDTELFHFKVCAINRSDADTTRFATSWRADGDIIVAHDRPAHVGREIANHRRRVRDLESRPPTIFFPRGVIDITHRDIWATAQFECVDADEFTDEVIFHVPAHPLNNRDDGDEEHDTDADAKQGESAFELLRSDCTQREPNSFENGHGDSRRCTQRRSEFEKPQGARAPAVTAAAPQCRLLPRTVRDVHRSRSHRHATR